MEVHVAYQTAVLSSAYLDPPQIIFLLAVMIGRISNSRHADRIPDSRRAKSEMFWPSR